MSLLVPFYVPYEVLDDDDDGDEVKNGFFFL